MPKNFLGNSCVAISALICMIAAGCGSIKDPEVESSSEVDLSTSSVSEIRVLLDVNPEIWIAAGHNRREIVDRAIVAYKNVGAELIDRIREKGVGAHLLLKTNNADDPPGLPVPTHVYSIKIVGLLSHSHGGVHAGVSDRGWEAMVTEESVQPKVRQIFRQTYVSDGVVCFMKGTYQGRDENCKKRYLDHLLYPIQVLLVRKK